MNRYKTNGSKDEPNIFFTRKSILFEKSCWRFHEESTYKNLTILIIKLKIKGYAGRSMIGIQQDNKGFIQH